MKRTLRIVLLVLLLSAAGMGKMDAQSFTLDDLNYSVNSDGASVTITGTTITSNSESFENGIPSDWTTIDADGDDNTWDIGWSGNSHSGAMYVTSLSYSNFALTPDNYLVSGQISFTSNTGIRFYVHSNAIQHFGVAISTRSQNNAADFTTIAEWTVTIEGDWFEYSVDLSSYAGQMGWVAIRHFDCMGQGSYSELVVDDVCVGEDYDSPPPSYSLNIPECVSYEGVSYVVTAIGDYAFYNCYFFNGNLTIPNSVSTIGNWAFGYCSGFTGSLTIPNSVTIIGEAAFASCHGFAGSLTISNSVTTIENSTFAECTGFTGSLTIPNSVTSIGNYAFHNCSGFIGDLIIPDSVISLGGAAFEQCNGFTGSLTIGNSVTSIGEAAFSWCSGFSGSLTIGNSVTSIGRSAFYDCNGLTGELIIPNSVTEIGIMSFSGCRGFTGDLTIPNSVTTIGSGAFSSCSGLTGSLIIPNSVTTIGHGAFSGCSGFTGDLIIPNSVTEISDRVFIYCGFTGSLTIPNSVTEIGQSAFADCKGFTENLTIGSSVATIDYNAFLGCSGFTSITSLAEMPPILDVDVFRFFDLNIPVYVPCDFVEEYLSLPWGEFSNFIGLCGDSAIVTVRADPEEYGSVTGGGVFEVGQTCPVTAVANEGYIFSHWTKNGIVMASVNTEYTFYVTGDMILVAHFVPEGNIDFADANVKSICVSRWDANDDGELSYIEAASVKTINDAFVNNTDITSFDELQYFIGLSSISGFDGCSGLTSIILPHSITSIGIMAFRNCSSLTGSLIIPNSVTTIGNYAFQYCSGLTSLIIGNCVTTIGNGAFDYCNGFTGTLNIPSSVTTIGNAAFYYCNGFTGSLKIPNSVTYIGNQAFTGCSGFTGDLVIPNSVTTIGNAAFFYCSGFTGNLTIGNSVTSIGNSAFQYCSGFTGSLTIGNSVTSIGNSAFSYCNSLNSMFMLSEIPPTLESNAFYRVASNTPVYVPCKSVETYQSFAGWDFFSNIIGMCSSGTISAVAFPREGGVVSGAGMYEGGSFCTVTATPNEGYYFACWSENGSVVSTDANYSFVVMGNKFLTARFVGEGNIDFADANVKALCVQNWDANGDGELSYLEAALVTSLGEVFMYNGEITSFEELQYFISLSSINDNAFSNCYSLTGSLILPNSVTSIGMDAFAGCSGFTGDLFIPNSVTWIDIQAFYGCSGFTGTLTIPNSVTLIEEGAFYACDGFTEVIMYGTTPPLLGDVVFVVEEFYEEPDYEIGYPIYVPYESLNSYKTANEWNNYENRVFPMAYTTIPGYGEGEGNYRFIASPLVEGTDPTTVDNMITETTYDLYRFNQSENAEWQNYKANTEDFVLENGQGYLYANEEEVNIIFKGTFNEDETKTVDLNFAGVSPWAGWNLVGNPFPVSAYANKSYYMMNESGSAIEPVAVSDSIAIPTCTGVMVKAESAGESVVFNKTVSLNRVNIVKLQITLSDTESGRREEAIIDKAVVSFNQGDALEKCVFNARNAQLYIPQGGKDYSIACVGNESEIPLNFKAVKNGEYAISVHVENTEMEYLHLIDNEIGADIDLLASPSYTFKANSGDDYARFKLVFYVGKDPEGCY